MQSNFYGLTSNPHNAFQQGPVSLYSRNNYIAKSQLLLVSNVPLLGGDGSSLDHIRATQSEASTWTESGKPAFEVTSECV